MRFIDNSERHATLQGGDFIVSTDEKLYLVVENTVQQTKHLLQLTSVADSYGDVGVIIGDIIDNTPVLFNGKDFTIKKIVPSSKVEVRTSIQENQHCNISYRSDYDNEIGGVIHFINGDKGIIAYNPRINTDYIVKVSETGALKGTLLYETNCDEAVMDITDHLIESKKISKLTADMDFGRMIYSIEPMDCITYVINN